MRRLALLLAAFAVAGCNRTDAFREHGRVVAIEVSGYRYTPQNVVVGRGPRTFFIRNAGRVPTNFRIRRRKRVQASLATLPPGEYATLDVRLRPGTYTMYSSVGRNETLGEYGTLTVR